MSDYRDVYLKRLNRYGLDYQSRVQHKREEDFNRYLLKSNYQVEFNYNNKIEVGSFERYKQDETKTLHYLLTKVDLEIPNGTILMIPNKNDEEDLRPWMVYYLEEIKSSGYNKYLMLRMTHYLTWETDNGQQESWAYMYGQEDNMLKDEIRSRSRMNVLYRENLKMSFFVMPRNQYIKKDVLFLVGEDPYIEQYRVTGYDIQSSLGIEYVTIDPTYRHDTSQIPDLNNGENSNKLFWLTGEDSSNG